MKAVLKFQSEYSSRSATNWNTFRPIGWNTMPSPGDRLKIVQKFRNHDWPLPEVCASYKVALWAAEPCKDLPSPTNKKSKNLRPNFFAQILPSSLKLLVLRSAKVLNNKCSRAKWVRVKIRFESSLLFVLSWEDLFSFVKKSVIILFHFFRLGKNQVCVGRIEVRSTSTHLHFCTISTWTPRSAWKRDLKQGVPFSVSSFVVYYRLCNAESHI